MDYAKQLLQDIDALDGERWFPKESEFEDDLPLYWGEWGVYSECLDLKDCLMRRPGKEVENFDWQASRFFSSIDPEKFRAQHDNLAQIYRDNGVRVHYVEEQREDRPNAIFCRDLCFMTPEGAIVTRPGLAARRGGVTAFVVSSVSYKYALIIESASTVEFLRDKAAPMMLSDYCILVRDYSIYRYSPLTAKIAGYILDHLPSPLSVNQLAEEFFLDPSSLSRKFKKETGFSITEFINQHRVKLAQYYLERGYHNISEVACLVGYSDSNYFCRIFKKLTTLTPTQYLDNIRTTGKLL